MNEVTATLSCGHFATLDIDAVMAGGTFRCWACEQRITGQALRDVVHFRAPGNGWELRCTRCQYGRVYGNASITAQTMATKHAITKNHDVRVLLDGVEQRIIHTTNRPLTDAAPF